MENQKQTRLDSYQLTFDYLHFVENYIVLKRQQSAKNKKNINIKNNEKTFL